MEITVVALLTIGALLSLYLGLRRTPAPRLKLTYSEHEDMMILMRKLIVGFRWESKHEKALRRLEGKATLADVGAAWRKARDG